MPKLIWSREALLDMRRVHRFLADVNPEAAARAVHTIRDSIKTIKQYPQSGRPVEGLDVQYRDWPIQFGNSGYLVRYWFDGKSVEILSVRHQRELP
jgi:plasmid stabilization system protein ParE